jgi:hypothetical protein
MSHINSALGLVAKLRRFIPLLCLFWSPLNVQAADPCGFVLRSHLSQQIRYVDPASLDARSSVELSENLKSSKQYLQFLEAEMVKQNERSESLSLDEQMREPRHSVAIRERNALEEEIRLAQSYVLALGRALARKSLAPAGRSEPIVSIALHTSGKSDQQMMDEIIAVLEKQGFDRNKLVARYFPVASQDLVESYGTDRHGVQADDSTWDRFGLEGTLMAEGLKADDGFYGLEINEAAAMDQYGPFVMIKNFIAGDRALVVYDATQVRCVESDLFVFKYPAKKRSAVKAIIRPLR